MGSTFPGLRGTVVSVWASLSKWDRLGVIAGSGFIASAGIMAVRSFGMLTAGDAPAAACGTVVNIPCSLTTVLVPVIMLVAFCDSDNDHALE